MSTLALCEVRADYIPPARQLLILLSAQISYLHLLSPPSPTLFLCIGSNRDRQRVRTRFSSHRPGMSQRLIIYCRSSYPPLCPRDFSAILCLSLSDLPNSLYLFNKLLVIDLAVNSAVHFRNRGRRSRSKSGFRTDQTQIRLFGSPFLFAAQPPCVLHRRVTILRIYAYICK